MKCKVHLCGDLEDFQPKFEKLRSEDQKWVLNFDKPRGQDHFKMNLSEVIRFLTMFDDIETIYFEVR